MESPGQQVLLQTAASVSSDGRVEARFTVGLPARGRRVSGDQATVLLLEDVPRLVDESLLAAAHDPEVLRRVVEANEDADALRSHLEGRGLVAFLADGAVLPRRSGVDDGPLEDDGVVTFKSPESLRVEIDLPNAGRVGGMGLPTGVTMIVGGGYHGKSTILRALERGVYNHRPGDGREQVVSDAATVKVRAEDGRSVAGVDISSFIGDLPLGGDTGSFSTANASGSTSQAAGIVEAVEAGARVLLVDEDTAATNFMIRDRRMQALIPKAAEPITPFVDRVRQLYDELGISTVLVIGGSGDYLEVADTVVAMREYRPRDVTAEALAIVQAHPTGRIAEVAGPLSTLPARFPDPASVDPRRGRREVSIRVRSPHLVQFGSTDLDLTGVEQIVSRAQTRALALALALVPVRLRNGRASVAQLLDEMMRTLEDEGLDALDGRKVGDLAEFRRYEFAAALNRLRTLRVDTGSS